MKNPVEQAWAERALIAEERCRQLEADNERLRASADPEAARKLTSEVVAALTAALGDRMPDGEPKTPAPPRQVGVWGAWRPQSRLGRAVASVLAPRRGRST